MTSAVQQAHEIVACALRPEGSLAHLATLIAFVLLAWRLAPPRPRRSVRKGLSVRRPPASWPPTP